MPIADLLMSGVNLMIWGMGIVFTFLVMLVFTMLGVARLVQAVEKGQGAGSADDVYLPAAGSQQSPLVRADLLAVISAAVARYRTTHQ